MEPALCRTDLGQELSCGLGCVDAATYALRCPAPAACLPPEPFLIFRCSISFRPACSGPFEVIDMCAALDIEPIITLAYDLNDPLDWADLVECELKQKLRLAPQNVLLRDS